ncbi:MAG TPA: patatin-like phospholipase family protein [Saprospiraceae bacterium]|nr:patatin-like phospholipase family protein [Saprospiraceae bacterium]
MKKFALVLSGGGFKGAFQVGALKYLKENWEAVNPGKPMKFDIIAGVSVGTLNGYMIAADRFDQLEKLWADVGRNGVEEIYTSDFIDTKSKSEKLVTKIEVNQLLKRFLPNFSLSLSLWKGLELLFSKSKQKKFLAETIEKAGAELGANLKHFKSLADNTPLKNKLATLVQVNAVKDCIFKCGFVSLDDGQYYSVKHNDFKTDADFQNGILASSAMPIIWEPVATIDTKDNRAKYAVDGGVRNVSPLSDVIDEINRDDSGAEYTIIIINCNNGNVSAGDFKDANIAKIALRSLTDITLAEIFNNDLKEFLRINDLLEQVEAVLPGTEIFNYSFQRRERSDRPLRTFKTMIIQPDDDVLGDTLIATQSLIEKRIKHGREKAEDVLVEMLQPA